MAIIKINTNPGPRELKQFGLIWLALLALLGGLAWWRTGGATAALVIWGLAVAVPAIGRAVPPFMRAVYVGLCYAALPIGLVVSFVLLAFLYFVVITPLGVLLRLLGRDPLQRRFAPELASHWVPRAPERPVEQYLRQF